jgi:methylglutaconyl-CoA hydratase
LDTDTVLLEIDARGVASAALNRPAVHNAYNLDMLEALIAGLDRVAADTSVRCLVIRGSGRNFQAGADIKWLNGLGRGAFTTNLHASTMTTRAMQRLN